MARGEELEFEVDLDLFERAMAEAPQRLYEELRSFLRKHHRAFVNVIKTERISSRKGAAGQAALSDRLSSRTGFLRRSIDTEVLGHDVDSLEVVSFSTAPYARIHELGGEITPQSSSWLAIPLRAVRTAAGVARGGPRDYPTSWIMRSKKRSDRLLVMRTLEDGSAEPLFVLVRRVTIPPRLGWMKTWRKMRRGLGRGLDAAAGRALSGDAA